MKRPVANSAAAVRSRRSHTVIPADPSSAPPLPPDPALQMDLRRITRSLSQSRCVLAVSAESQAEPDPRAASEAAASPQVSCYSQASSLPDPAPSPDAASLAEASSVSGSSNHGPRHLPPAPPSFYSERVMASPTSIFHRRKTPLSAPTVTTRGPATMSPFRPASAPQGAAFPPRPAGGVRRASQSGDFFVLTSWQVKVALVAAALFGFVLAVVYINLRPAPAPTALIEGQWMPRVGLPCAQNTPSPNTEINPRKDDDAVGSPDPSGALNPPEPQIAFDYALLSLGARVLSTRDTQPLTVFDAKILGFTVYQESEWNSLQEAPLLPLIVPGRCWRFQGFPGRLVIQLAEPVDISAFSLSHLSSRSVPPSRLTSAPSHFEVWALADENDEDGVLLGNYTYVLSPLRPSQHFPVQQPLDRAVAIVELRVLANHGHPHFTCVYRFKVFGMPVENMPDE
ncbi:uncharacterized protein LOC129599974 [Paramacrobiotus metropolitanus]|uniref:uncharacterized protein LOC129599974 n=1 Tax=Paramacrobiotus metropolitanus TaxID=2943436 RepID=UPI0024465A17|nr:uncharacterized protein LOC129599974 [Paramacrobiotus metropolitanus]